MATEAVDMTNISATATKRHGEVPFNFVWLHGHCTEPLEGFDDLQIEHRYSELYPRLQSDASQLGKSQIISFVCYCKHMFKFTLVIL